MSYIGIIEWELKALILQANQLNHRNYNGPNLYLHKNLKINNIRYIKAGPACRQQKYVHITISY